MPIGAGQGACRTTCAAIARGSAGRVERYTGHGMGGRRGVAAARVLVCAGLVLSGCLGSRYEGVTVTFAGWGSP